MGFFDWSVSELKLESEDGFEGEAEEYQDDQRRGYVDLPYQDLSGER